MPFNPYTITCPHCLAQPGRSCFDRDFNLVPLHDERIQGEVSVGDKFMIMSQEATLTGTSVKVISIPRDGDIVIRDANGQDHRISETWLYNPNKYRKC